MVIKRFLKDERGSVLPMVAILLILIIGIGCASFSIVIMNRDRTTVREALDASVASSLEAVAKEETRGIYQSEKLECVEKLWTMHCRKKVCTNRDSEGKCTSYKWVYWDEKVCSLKAWQNTQSNYKNYVWLDKGKATAVARQYLEENLKLNNLEGRAKIKGFKYEVIADTDRKYAVKKDRYLTRPYKQGTPPNGWNDPGTPAETAQYTRGGKKLLNNPGWNEYDGKAWWMVEFDGVEPMELSNIQNWTSQRQEVREVYFPRWVKVRATVSVELPVIYGGLFKKPNFTTSYTTEFYVKELSKVVN